MADCCSSYDSKAVEDAFIESWNELSQYSTSRLRNNMLAYMGGDRTRTPGNQTVVDLITSGEFVQVNHNLRMNLAHVTTKWYATHASDGIA